ncbi:MAG: hypothetical protein ACKV2V_06525 [Blastocatellia bacterium]
MPNAITIKSNFNAGELALWGRLFEPAGAAISPDAARFLLTLHFPQADLDRMNELAGKARAGALSLEEQIELDDYERVGHVLSLLKSKARQALKPSRNGKQA